MSQPRVLSVAGSDPSGGAGVQADLCVFAAFGCAGMAVPAALTAQSPIGVRSVSPVEPEFVARCVEVLLSDCPPVATKTGMLLSAPVIERVTALLSSGAGGPVVVDPVMIATSGVRLLDPEAVAVLATQLVPLAHVVTPNASELEALTGVTLSSDDAVWLAAGRLIATGCYAVLAKGGHLGGGFAVDRLLIRGGERHVWTRPRLDVGRTHGTGCALSAAIASMLARGVALPRAVEVAGDYVHAAIAAGVTPSMGARSLDFAVRVPGMEAGE